MWMETGALFFCLLSGKVRGYAPCRSPSIWCRKKWVSRIGKVGVLYGSTDVTASSRAPSGIHACTVNLPFSSLPSKSMYNITRFTGRTLGPIFILCKVKCFHRDVMKSQFGSFYSDAKKNARDAGFQIRYVPNILLRLPKESINWSGHPRIGPTIPLSSCHWFENNSIIP